MKRAKTQTGGGRPKELDKPPSGLIPTLPIPTSLQAPAVLTDEDFRLSQATGWVDPTWFFSRGRALAQRLRGLPADELAHRLACALDEVKQESGPTATTRAWDRVLAEGRDALCQVLEDPADGGHTQVLRTSLPRALWDGLMDEGDRQALMAQVRSELQDREATQP